MERKGKKETKKVGKKNKNKNKKKVGKIKRIAATSCNKGRPDHCGDGETLTEYFLSLFFSKRTLFRTHKGQVSTPVSLSNIIIENETPFL